MLHTKSLVANVLISAVICTALIGASQASAKQLQLWDREITFEGSWGRMNQKADYLEWQKGMLYRRTTILDKPDNDKQVMQLCVWSGGETCSPCETPLVKKGDIVYSRTTPKSWWKKSGALSGWASQGIRAYIIKTSCGGGWLSTCGGGHCQKSAAAPHLPIKIRVEEWYIDEGEQFVCPEGWSGTPDKWGCTNSVETIRSVSAPDMHSMLQLIPSANGTYEIVAPGLKNISVHSVRGRAISTVRQDTDGALVLSASLKSHSVVVISGRTENGRTVSSSFVLR